jgi:hypothetical protein
MHDVVRLKWISEEIVPASKILGSLDLRLLVTPLVSSNFFRIGGKARVVQ